MSDANREIGINIKTTADLAAAKETAKEVANLEKATQSADKAGEKSKESTKQLTESKKELKDVLKGLSLEFPALSRAISLATNPVALLGAALGVAAAKFGEWHSKVQAVLAEQGKLQSFSDTARDLSLHIAEFSNKISNFESNLTRIGVASEAAGTKVAGLNKAVERAAQLQDSLGDLTLDLKIKQLDDDIAKGKIKPEQRGEEVARLQFANTVAKVTRREDALKTQAAQHANAALLTDSEIEAARGRRPDAAAVARAERKADITGKAASRSQSNLDTLTADRETEIGGLKKQITDNMEFLTSDSGDPVQQAAAGGIISRSTGRMNALLNEIKREKAKNTEVQRKADEAARDLKEINETLARANADLQSAIQRKAEHDQKSKELFDEYKAHQNFNRQTLPLIKQIGEQGVATEKFKADQQRAKEDAEFYFKIYQEADQMPRGQREKFIDRHLPTTGATGGSVAPLVAAQSSNETLLNEVLTATLNHQEEVAATLRKVAEKLYVLDQRISDVAASV